MSDKGRAQILDLDAMVPDKRVVRVDGREFDLTRIPARTFLSIAKIAGEMKSAEDMGEQMHMAIGVIVTVLQATDESIDEDWVEDTLDASQLMALMEFITDSFLGEGEGGEAGKAKASESDD